jgi:hypothetical protein
LTTMHPKITIVVDNRVGQGLSGEHGFSVWIETGTEPILFDTGQGSALVENARKLGIGLEQTISALQSLNPERGFLATAPEGHPLNGWKLPSAIDPFPVIQA